MVKIYFKITYFGKINFQEKEEEVETSTYKMKNFTGKVKLNLALLSL